MINTSSNRIVIITGAGGGVGKTVTRRWLESGASVLAVDAGKAGLEAVQSAWQESGGDMAKLALYSGDLSQAEGAAAMVAQAKTAFGSAPDTLVHLVGGFGMGPLDAPDAPDLWNRMMLLNLTTAFHAYRAVLPGMKARGEGWIVGIASRAAVQPAANLAAYAASKAALIALTQSLALEVRDANIHVNVILPSTIDTPANRAAMGDQHAAAQVSPDDIAEATLYLCSSAARSVFGATLELYGKV